MEFFKWANNEIDDHIKHHNGVVDDEECTKRKMMRCLACPICSMVWSLRFMSNNKDMEELQDVDGLYQTDQELEKYIDENREHIEKHGLIQI